MNKNLGVKTAVIIVVLLAFVYGIFGVPSGLSGSNLLNGILSASPLRDGVHLGLDLKGGTHLILQVQVNEAVSAEVQQVGERLKSDLQSAGVSYGNISQPDPQNRPEQLVIASVPSDASSTLQRVVNDRYPDYQLSATANNGWNMTLKAQAAEAVRTNAVQQAIETIRSRIDQLGVSEPTIQEHGLGRYQILVELPGIDDPGRVRGLLQSTAMLQIRQALDNGSAYSSEDDALKQHNGVLPPDSVLLPGLLEGRNGEAPKKAWYLVTRSSIVSGRDIRDARSGTNGTTGQANVNFFLTADAGRRFGNWTGAHVGDFLAVVLDNNVREVAVVKEQIHDTGEISGGMDPQVAKDTAMILRSGSLPASLTNINENTVGPSLGADSIRHGVMAAVIGMTAVLVFMLIYYRGAGVNADLALVLNLIILLGFLGYFGAALTLPGIAGVILTVGMGVDSNVLIFERIREELRNGKTAAAAVDQGFSHAWITIVDTHVTTIVSAFILFIFGTGPVRGFATTLTFGLLANLFTSVFVSRVIFDAILNRKQAGEALSI